MVSIVQPTFSGGELSPELHGRIDLARYRTSLAKCRNAYPHTQGGVSNRPGTRFVGPVDDHARKHRNIRFQYNVDQTYVLEFGHQTMRIVYQGAYVVYPVGHASAGQIVTVATPYGEEHIWDLKFVQSADVVTFTHSSFPIKDLKRMDHHDWAWEDVSFDAQIAAPTNLQGTASHAQSASEVYKYKVTAIKEDGDKVFESEGSTEVAVDSEILTVTESYVKKIDLTWTSVSGASKYNIYKEKNGLYGFIGATEGTTFKDDNIAPDLSDAIPQYNNPFNEAGKYPSCVAYYQQRRMFAGQIDAPGTIHGTKTGYYNSMAKSSPVKDDDAFSHTLASEEVNDIRHLISLDSLLVLTNGGEWRASGGSVDTPMTPSNFSAKRQGTRGASRITPLVIGNEVLFVQNKSARVRSLTYSLQTDSLIAPDISILSEHFFRNVTIVDWAYQQEPDSLIWAVRSDGKLLSFTYLPEQEVWAWALHETDGAFESVCVVSEGERDVPYFIVRRTIGGQEKRFQERMEVRELFNIRDAFFVDCGLSYDGVATSTISGLDHLEGEAVAILADGSVVSPRIVSGGTITLDQPAVKVHVGLPYQSVLETLELELEPTIAGRKKRVTSVLIKVLNSRGIFVGAAGDETVEIKQREHEALGDPIELLTTDFETNVFASWGDKGKVSLVQRDPLPMTILAVVPNIDVAS